MRTLLLSLLCAVFSTAAGEITLPDLLTPPTTLPPSTPKLAPILPDGATAASWEAARAELRSRWLKELGTWPPARTPLAARFLEKETLEGFTRQYVQYQIEADLWTDGYLLVPEPAGDLRRAGVVVFHPTTPLQAKGVAGIAPEYSEEKRQGVQLVQRGFVVWCPRNFLFDDIATGLKGKEHYVELTRRIQQKHPDWTGLMRMLWEGVRAADFMESLPSVDPARIGCAGHSLGAKVALYSAAFDTRYRATVFSEGGIGLRMSNWNDTWYLGSKINAPGFALDNHQVLALIAPRPFLLLGGESADTDAAWAYLQAARPVYALSGAEKKLAWWNHRLGHTYPPRARLAAETFLLEHLKP